MKLAWCFPGPIEGLHDLSPASLRVFKEVVSGLAKEDAKNISEDQWVVHKPVLWLGAARDAVCVPQLRQPDPAFVTNVTSKVIDVGHWLMFDAENEVNSELEAWLERL
ncbi:hypothetical protein CC1G_06196 [Coprinopsis cinerea okayama7|uniref:AB hydrolase-1 domain-containing protein n=1 Tax=Coprinopsis cinerea (strain Okayama-7 / 130 / ATCC MYA-4618 / FGSC 9003) TaxID=240176 RepID=A8NV64_COPC7|nr:hypothetical protein CC1G_06196 [Coprinopsis cinerea okayama7\|eukprot:XP_001836609.1 hypothetical protein CC1G_06196 [Coprinopsis cinerea okayama7\